MLCGRADAWIQQKRRYADIIVHRLLSLGLIDSDQRHDPESLQSFAGANEGDLEFVAEHCNTKKRASKDAQERSERIFLSVYVQRLPVGYLDQPAIVIGVGEKSFTVLVIALGMECRIYMEDMPDLLSVFDEKCHTLTVTTAPKHSDNTSGQDNVVDRLADRMSKLAQHDRATFDAFALTIFTPVIVRLYPRTRPPVDLRVTLLSPQ